MPISDLRRFPTLIIGLGGSGTKTVCRVKEKYERRVTQDHPLVQFLAFDTDSFQGGQNNLRPHKEFVHLANYAAGPIVSDLDSWPDIKKWWRSSHRPGFISQGAGGVRAVGRLSLFAKFKEMRDAMEGAIRECYETAVKITENQEVMGDNQSLSPEHLKKVRVYIIGSVCGGTGTGMLLDAALLINHFIRTQTQAHPSIQGVFYLPSVFEQDIVNPDYMDHLQVNTTACLMDLEYLNQHGELTAKLDPPISYPDTNYTPISQVEEPPFNGVFVVGRKMGVENVVQMLPNQEEVFERAADMIMLELSSATGNQLQSVMDNFDQSYASFGVLRKELPEKAISTAWCHMAVADLLERARNHPENPETIKREVRASCTETDVFIQKFSAPELPQVLDQDISLQQRLRAVRDCDSLSEAQSELESLISHAHSKVRDYARGEYSQPAEISRLIVAEIQSSLGDAFHRSSGSLRIVEEILNETLGKLPDQQAYPDIESLRQRISLNLTSSLGSSFKSGKKRKIEKSISDVRSLLPPLLVASYRAELWNNGGNVIRQKIQTSLENHRSAFRELEQRLEFLKEAAEVSIANHKTYYEAISHNAITWNQVEERFKDIDSSLRTNLFARRDFADSVLKSYIEEASDMALVKDLRENPMLEYAASEQIKVAYPDGLIAEIDSESIYREIEFTDALIQIEQRGPRNIAQTSYVGVNGGERSKFATEGLEKGFMRDYRFIDTEDALSVDTATVCHDFELGQVSEIAQCRKKYAAKREQLYANGLEDSLYLFHVLGVIPDVSETGPNSPSDILFGVAMALGFVVPRGQRYFYSIADEGKQALLQDDEVIPVERLRKARQRFNGAQLSKEVKEYLESEDSNSLKTRIINGVGERMNPLLDSAEMVEQKDELRKLIKQATDYAGSL